MHTNTYKWIKCTYILIYIYKSAQKGRQKKVCFNTFYIISEVFKYFKHQINFWSQMLETSLVLVNHLLSKQISVNVIYWLKMAISLSEFKWTESGWPYLAARNHWEDKTSLSFDLLSKQKKAKYEKQKPWLKSQMAYFDSDKKYNLVKWK